MPRFLPEIRPTPFNYPVAIHGKWHSNTYRFITRYRSDQPDSIATEFDVPFTRIEYVARDRFDISYFRHTGKWHCIYRGVTLAEAIKLIKTDELLYPH